MTGDTVRVIDVEELWAEHLKDDFPASARGEERNAIDLAYLDSSAAGAITSAIAGSAEPALLRSLRDDLESVTPDLTGNALVYFGRLREIVAALADAQLPFGVGEARTSRQGTYVNSPWRLM